MEQIFEYIKQYSLPVFIIASCIIALIGILKLCKVFDKISNKNIKKCIYYMLNVALAFSGAAIYFAAFKISFTDYVAFSFTQVGATTTLYAIYENFGVRKLVQMLLDWLSSKLKSDPDNALSKTLKKLGLTEDAIANVKATVTAEAEKAEAEKASAPETPVETTTEVKQ